MLSSIEISTDIVKLRYCYKREKCIHPNNKGDGLLTENDFSKKNSGSIDGFQSYCKVCYRKIHDEYTSTIIGRFRKIAIEANYRNKTSIVTHKELMCLYVSQDGKCPIIDKPLRLEYTSLDHIKPIHTGGANYPSNLIFVHRVLNSGKNGFRMNFLLDILDKDKKLVWSRIMKAHETYLKNIDRFNQMADDDLEMEIVKVLAINNLTNKTTIKPRGKNNV